MQVQKILKDEYTSDGKRMCNLSKPMGVIYSDGFSEAKYLQEGQYYRGDRTPIEGMTQRPNDPPKRVELETTPEEVAVAKRVDGLETRVQELKTGVEQLEVKAAATAEGVAAILAILNKPKKKPGPKKKVAEPAP
jgi:hypothetical protein